MDIYSPVQIYLLWKSHILNKQIYLLILYISLRSIPYIQYNKKCIIIVRTEKPVQQLQLPLEQTFLKLRLLLQQYVLEPHTLFQILLF